MKVILKLGILIASLIMHLVGTAQNSQKVYDAFNSKEGAFVLSFSKSVLEPFEFLLDDETKKVVYRMNKVKFLSYNDKKGNMNSKAVFYKISSNLEGGKYFEIDPNELNCDDCQFDIEVDGNDEFKLIGHGSNSRKLDELHVLIQSDNHCVLFSFFGDISVEDLKECAKFSQSTKGLFNP